MYTSEGKDEIILQGIGVSPGIAIAPAHVVASGAEVPDVYEIPASEIAYEQQRFHDAVSITLGQLSALKHKLESYTSSAADEAKIFEAHQLIIQDKALSAKVLSQIEERHQNAEAVFYAVIHNYSESMRRINDPYLRERAADLDDICQRVLRNFSDANTPEEGPEHQHIIITHDLAPSDTAVMDKNLVLGFVTEVGSLTSHTAILARSLGIPAIVGLDEILINTVSLSDCIIDGDSGKLIIHPSQDTLAFYKAKQQEIQARIMRDFQLSRETKVTSTSDGHNITLSANIEFSHEIDKVNANGAEGVGLYRTEFFLLNQEKFPSEQAQFEEYKKVAEQMGEHMVIIRTLDAGGDKLHLETLSEPEPNPFLGWRGIRVSLSRKDLFKSQLRAALRASAFGNVGIMFPMVSGITEVKEAKQVFELCKQELEAEGGEYDANVQLGVMIEVPSAAIVADKIAEHVDFFSIGTNDLVQYTMAVDRVNSRVSHLYRPCNPAVIRLIKMTVEAGKAKGIWTGVCGEMAGTLDIVPLLIGLGVDELSVGISQLPKIKHIISQLDFSKCQELARLALDMDNSFDIRRMTREMAYQSYPEYLTED